MKTLILMLLPFFGQAQKQLNMQIDTIKVKMLVSDENDKLSIMNGYEVMEKRNERNDSVDPGFYPGVIYKDYYIHIKYLDANKKELAESITVWQSK